MKPYLTERLKEGYTLRPMLRISGGEFKGRNLKSPPTSITRPAMGLIRKSIFDSCQGEIQGAVVADLFAGSGILGLEALSRGAKRATFIEKNNKVIDCIKENVTHLDVRDKATILEGDVYALFNTLPDSIDIAFLDPPYTIGLEGYLILLNFLHDHQDQFASEAHIYLEARATHAKEIAGHLPTSLSLRKEKKSSTTTLFHLIRA